MRTIEHCPGCGGLPSRRWPALVAPFIAEYALRSPVAACALLECGACGLRYFDARPDEAEMARLYSGYRGEAYFQARHRHEPWYLRRHNRGQGQDPRLIAARRAAVEAFLRRHDVAGRIDRVLDYGGDAGQFIPEGLGTERHVFEVSDALPVAGVRRIADEGALVPGSYDLVLLNHVLEHLAEPVELLRRTARLLRPGSGILYVEVPLERYRLGWGGQGPGPRRRLAWLASHPALLRWLDFYSTVCRVLLGVLPPLGLLRAHEHLNLFHERSLGAACRAAGLEVLAFDQGKRGGTAVVAALARRPPAP